MHRADARVSRSGLAMHRADVRVSPIGLAIHRADRRALRGSSFEGGGGHALEGRTAVGAVV